MYVVLLIEMVLNDRKLVLCFKAFRFLGRFRVNFNRFRTSVVGFHGVDLR